MGMIYSSFLNQLIVIKVGLLSLAFNTYRTMNDEGI